MAGRKKITQKQLNALARGRRTAMANRKTKKKKVTRSRRKTNPAARASMYSTILLAGPNDSNGNPRRVYVTLKGGAPVGVWEQGYSGTGAIEDAKMRAAFQGITIKVSASEVREWLRIYRSASMQGMGVKHNPAHGNFLNAIAAKERGGLGREAYQNPVRPLRNPVPQLQIASIDPRKRNIVFWGAFGWGPRNKALGFPTQTEAKKVAQKMKRPVVIVLPYHTTVDIYGAFKQ